MWAKSRKDLKSYRSSALDPKRWAKATGAVCEDWFKLVATVVAKLHAASNDPNDPTVPDGAFPWPTFDAVPTEASFNMDEARRSSTPTPAPEILTPAPSPGPCPNPYTYSNPNPNLTLTLTLTPTPTPTLTLAPTLTRTLTQPWP